jgi:hypothetical protein|nr:MAG TPA: hypothetical protein [Bacteriophage sp.]
MNLFKNMGFIVIAIGLLAIHGLVCIIKQISK